MALPTGLIPVLAFVLTVGISGPVALAAGLSYRSGTRSFGRALQVALLEAGLLSLVGVGVVWAIAGGGPSTELWEIPATLVVTGIGASLVLASLPLVVGKHLVGHLLDVEPETALRFTTYGWPIGMLVVFGIFIAPGGPTQGHLVHLEGTRICLAGFCGIAVSFVVAVLLEVLVAVFAPGLFGALIASRRRDRRQ
jgi:hypothetical protein